MKKNMFFFWMLLAVTPALAEMTAKLPQVMRPLGIALADERVYVVEDFSKIHIYNRGLQGVAFERTFGGQGDEPGEFNEINHVQPLNDHLEILSFGRLARFSLDGRFLDEMKLPVRVFKDGIFRIGENYLVRDFRFDDHELSISIRLYSKDFKKVQELVAHTIPLGDKINLATDYYSVRVVGDRAYVVESGKETKVTVYDQAGAKLREISLSLEPVQVSTALKEILLKPLKDEPDWRAGDETLYGFPDWTPGLDYFDVVDGKFIARTYEYRENKVEFVIFDLQGKELNRTFLPNVGYLSHAVLFCFFQGRFYYLRKNPADGAWDLHEEKAW
jgi:hypothetical protein